MAMIQAPAYATYQSEQFAVVEVIEEAFKDHLAFCESLGVDGYEPPNGLEWQYDGQTYGPLAPGQTMTLPLRVAKHGVQKCMAYTQRNEDGIPRRNFRAKQKPMLRIVEYIDPAKMNELVMRQNAATPALCSWCGQSVPEQEYKGHVEARFANGGVCPEVGGTASNGKSVPDALARWREKKAAEAAEQQTDA